ncbi:MAG: DD-peptidase zinc-binding protein [Rhizobium sp.]|nr:DD-peptidase zinc-binding protein [Rhizobium sp.]
MLRVLRHGFAVLLLTLLTQIGGLAWLLALALRRLLPSSRRSVFLILFSGVYAVATLVTHQIAPMFGRVPLPCFTSADLAVRTPFYCTLNRNYVTAELKAAAEAYADHMASSFPGTKTLALDANFPFVTGFPLMPHLSHDDGRKLDLALYYRDDVGNFRNGETRSPLGYFAFQHQQPLPNSSQPCADRRRFISLRWDMNWLQPLFPDWDIEPARMKEALQWLSTAGRSHGIEKVFIEPHIPARLGVTSGMLRFQGCRAARHDDHIHIQLR